MKVAPDAFDDWDEMLHRQIDKFQDKVRNAMPKTREQLEEENEIMRSIIQDTFWMARRYANQRLTTAPWTVNECLGKMTSVGIMISSDSTLIEDGNSSADILDIN